MNYVLLTVLVMAVTLIWILPRIDEPCHCARCEACHCPDCHS